MKKIIVLFLIFFCELSIATPAEDFFHLLNSYTTYSADFKQVIVTDASSAPKISIGHLDIARPGQFFWRTTTPFQEEIILNGHTLWHYDIAFMQATKTTIASLHDTSTPAGLLASNTTKWMPQYAVSLIMLQGKPWYELLPKKGNTTQKLYFYFNNQKLTQLIFINDLNERSLFTFSHIKINHPFPPHHFEFTPPKGVAQ